MPYKSQSGFAPILILILLAIIAGSSMLVIKNIPFNQPTPTPTVEKQGTDSAQVKTSPSPATSKVPTVTSSKKPIPTPTKAPTTTNNTSNNSNPTNNTPNPTNTPAPTVAPANTPTPIPSPTASPLPASSYVRVTYPNGGEGFTVGDNLTITWDTNMPMGNCAIQTIDSNNSGSNVSSGVNVTNRSISWTATNGNTTLTQKQYKIYMICHDFNGGTLFATSSDYFTIHK